MRRITLVTAPALAVAMLLPALPAEATFGGSNGRISFARVIEATGALEVFSAAANGTGVTRLTDSGLDPDGNARSAVFSDWSPDGSTIAFDSDRVDADDNADVVQLYAMDWDGSNVRQLTAGPGFHGDPAYSPNGQRLAFETDWGNYPADQGIWTMPASSIMATKAVAQRVTTLPYADGFDSEPQYSPDGSTIVFTRFAQCRFHPTKDRDPRGCHQAIFTVRTDGSQLKQLTAWGRQNSAPDWSPDGTRIAFDSGDTGRLGSTGDIWVMNSNGSGKRRLTHNPPVSLSGGAFTFQLANNPVWSPNGAKILYTQWHGDGPTTLDVMNADGSGVTTLVAGDSFQNKVDWGTHP